MLVPERLSSVLTASQGQYDVGKCFQAGWQEIDTHTPSVSFINRILKMVLVLFSMTELVWILMFCFCSILIIIQGIFFKR